jgi:dihydroxyacetone kinase-like protein
MSTSLDYQGLVAMLLGSVEQIRAHHERLGELDSFGGDGDHGTTMLRAIENLEKATRAAQEKTEMGALLGDVAWAVMGTDGGATGPLFGSFFMGMSSAAPMGNSLDGAALAAMFSAGLASLQKQTKAQVGDKTIVDALVPAITAMEEAASAGGDAVTVLQQGATAAAAGAASTKNIEARFGRAKNAGEKSLGHEDPGAVSASLLFKGFLEGVQQHG